MEFIRIDSNDGTVLCMQIADVEGVSAIKGVDVVVEFVPEVWSDGGAAAGRGRTSAYQNVSAASFGPGNAAMGLKQRR